MQHLHNTHPHAHTHTRLRAWCRDTRLLISVQVLRWEMVMVSSKARNRYLWILN
jgi:hypothetical protein